MKKIALVLLALLALNCGFLEEDYTTSSYQDSGYSKEDTMSTPDSVVDSKEEKRTVVIHKPQWSYPEEEERREVSEEPLSFWCLVQKIEVCTVMGRLASYGIISGKKVRWLCTGPGSNLFDCP